MRLDMVWQCHRVAGGVTMLRARPALRGTAGTVTAPSCPAHLPLWETINSNLITTAGSLPLEIHKNVLKWFEVVIKRLHSTQDDQYSKWIPAAAWSIISLRCDLDHESSSPNRETQLYFLSANTQILSCILNIKDLMMPTFNYWVRSLKSLHIL